MTSCTILDLVISTHPDMVSQVEVVPGISDHETITFQIDQPLSKSPASKLQKVYQYHKAEIIEEMNNFTTSFLANNL